MTPLWTRLLTVLMLSALSLPALGQSEWDPNASAEEQLEQTAAYLAGRLLTVDFGRELGYPHFVEASRRSLSALANRLTRRGAEDLASLAPPLSSIPFPPTNDRFLDAMARYEACTIYLNRNFDAPGDDLDLDARLTAAMGPTYLRVTSRFLADAFLFQGGSEEDLRGFLENPERETILAQIASNVDWLEETRTDCAPALELLFGADENPEFQ